MCVCLHILSLKSLYGFGRNLAKETFVKVIVVQIKFSYIRSPYEVNIFIYIVFMCTDTKLRNACEMNIEYL
jgi:hypothetical protein